MSFAIEVPGEASPLNLQELCSKLLQAGSADHNQRQSASQQLTAWEAYPDYYAGLQVSHSPDPQRYQSHFGFQSCLAIFAKLVKINN